MSKNNYIDIFKAIGKQDYVILKKDYREIIQKSPLVNGLWTVGNWFCFVGNTHAQKLEMVTGNSLEVIGYTPDEIIRNNARFVAELIHNADFKFVTSVMSMAMQYVNDIPLNQRPMVYVVFYNRSVRKDGRTIITQNQNIPIVFDENNIPFIFSNIITDITHLGPNNIPAALLVNKYTGVNLHIDPQNLRLKPFHSIFTDREMDIIRLLIQGKNSREVAGLLNISPETVRTHRKNILAKAGLTNTNKLISYFMLNGPQFI